MIWRFKTTNTQKKCTPLERLSRCERLENDNGELLDLKMEFNIAKS